MKRNFGSTMVVLIAFALFVVGTSRSAGAQGCWAVNPNCTGNVTVEVFESGVLVRTSVLSVVFDGNRRELRAVQQSLTLPDGTSLPAVITFEGRRVLDN